MISPGGSTSNTAALYVLFVDGPDASGRWRSGGPRPDYVKLRAVDPADPASLPNGLSQPTWVDNNADGVADVVQALATVMPLNSPEAMRWLHSAGPVMWALVPPASTATVTGMSTTSNS